MQPKVYFFTWEMVWGKVLTLDQLQKRDFDFTNRYYLCSQYEETVDYLLLHCTKIRLL